MKRHKNVSWEKQLNTQLEIQKVIFDMLAAEKVMSGRECREEMKELRQEAEEAGYVSGPRHCLYKKVKGKNIRSRT